MNYKLCASTYLHVGLYLALLLLSACVGKTPALMAINDAGERLALLSAIRAEQAKLISLKASGVFQVTYEGVFNSLTYGAVFQSPNQCRFDTYILFGKLAASMVIRNDSLFTYSPFTNQALFIPLADTTALQQIPLPLAASELLAMFTGNIALPDSDAVEMAYVGKNIRLSWQRDPLRYEALYDAKKLALKKLTIIRQEKAAMLAEFSEYKKFGGIYRPQQVTILKPATGDRISLTFSKQQINVPIPASSLKLNIPENAEILIF